MSAILLTGCGGGGSSNALHVPTVTSAQAVSAGACAVETRGSSDAFVDSIGVNVHLAFSSTFYGNFGAVQTLLQQLGVRHYRDGIDLTNSASLGRIKALGAQGITADVIATENTQTPAAIESFLAQAGSAVDTVEGPNEFDQPSVPTWPQILQAYQSSLYAAVASGTGQPVIAPSMEQTSDFALAGSYASDSSCGNMHDYFAGRNPGTGGWGATDSFGTFGSLSWNIAIASQLTPGLPIMSTETGYTNGPGDSEQYAVPANIAAHYTLRLLLAHWNANVARTYIYELADEGSPPFAHYGLVDGSGNPKPAYTALQSMIAHLSDPGPAFTPASITFALSAPSSVQHAVLERHNGSYVLVLWNEQPEWNPVSNTLTPLAPVSATITLANAPSALSVTTIADTGVATTTPLTAGVSIPLQITGMPLMLDITP